MTTFETPNDVDLIDPALADLKQTFRSGKTKSAAWRKAQLQAFIDGINAMEQEICDAVYKDLGRDRFTTKIAECQLSISSAQHDLANVDNWMKPINEPVELSLAPARCEVNYEPLGVVAIYGSWNYPFTVVCKPLTQAIAAGNCCIIKPSEMAPYSSAIMKKLVQRFMDKDCFRVLEGGIPVAVKLNKSKLDMICFTGSTFVGKIIAETAAKNLTPCLLELGGKCPAVIDQSANIDFTSSKIITSRMQNSG